MDACIYRVESEVEEFSQERIRAKDPRCANVGCLREHHSSYGEDDVNCKPCHSTSPRADTLPNSDAENLAGEEGDLVKDERDLADLAFDISPTVYGCRCHAFTPHDENQSNVVGPYIDAVEKPVAKFRAVRQRERQGQKSEST